MALARTATNRFIQKTTTRVLNNSIYDKMAYVMRASHSKKFSSFIGPARIPSGGFIVNSEKANITRLKQNEFSVTKIYHIISIETSHQVQKC